MDCAADVLHPCAVHVVGVQHVLSVDRDRGQCVQAFADQEQRIAGQCVLGQRKRAAVQIILLHEKLCIQFIGAPIGIVHPPVIKQVGID